MKYILFSLLILPFVELNAQKLDGIWQGKLTQEPGGCFPEYYIELHIQSGKSEIEGVSYDYYDTSQFVKLNFSGVFGDKSNKKILLTEKQVVKERIPDDCVPCLKTYNLSYSKQNNVESLSGSWVGQDMGTIAGCPPGQIYLRKVQKSVFDDTRQRKNEISQVYLLDSPNVKVDFYDNGVVDGDSVSIFLDNKILLSKQGLSLTPFSLNLTLLPAREYTMMIYAENLGSIPPNTALVVITSGNKKYDVLVSTSEEKSALIKFIYKKIPTTTSR